MDSETMQRLYGKRDEKRAAVCEYIRASFAFDDAERRFCDSQKAMEEMVRPEDLPLVVYLNGKVYTIDENMLPAEATYITE